MAHQDFGPRRSVLASAVLRRGHVRFPRLPGGFFSVRRRSGGSVDGRASLLCALVGGLLVGLQRFFRGRLGLTQRLASSLG